MSTRIFSSGFCIILTAGLIFGFSGALAFAQGQTQTKTDAATTPAQAQPKQDIQTIDNQAIAQGLVQASQPVDAAHANEELRNSAFQAALTSVLPLKPDEIKILLERLGKTQQAASQPINPSPKPEVAAETISLQPGAQPPEIETQSGFVTTLSFLDETGAPWPILDLGVGGNFDIPAPEEGGNVLRITPLSHFGEGNLSIRLVTLTTPISFHLKAGGNRVHYRYDARIPKLGPNANAPLIDRGNTIAAGDDILMNVLDGIPPVEFTRLTVNGVDSRTAAWRMNNRVYLRTPLQLLSPGWDASVASADGTKVYSIADTPVILLSENGVLVHARIANKAQPNDEPVQAIADARAHKIQHIAAVQPVAGQSGTGQAATQSDDSFIPAPASSRTLIRPVKTVAPAQTATPVPVVGAATATPPPSLSQTLSQTNSASSTGAQTTPQTSGALP